MMSESAPITREQTAYHEAGHYVAAYVLRPDHARYGVTIKPHDDYLGSFDSEEGATLNEDGEVVLTAEHAGALLVELYAGWAAERRHTPTASAASGAGDNLKATDYLYLLEATDISEEPAFDAKYDWMGTTEAAEAEARWRAKADAFVSEHQLDFTEADMIMALSRGEAGTTAHDLARYRAFVAQARSRR